MTDEQLQKQFDTIQGQFNAIHGQFQALEDRLIKFMAREFGDIRREFAAFERRLSFMGDTTTALTKQSQSAELEGGQILGAQAGQQKAIEDLDRRVRALEEKNGSRPNG